MNVTRQAKPQDVVKAELHLSNGDYEAIYADIANRMQASGLLGTQIRSIKAKAKTRKIGTEIRQENGRMFNGVSDATFDTNILRIAQRVNSNERRVKRRLQASNKAGEACDVDPAMEKPAASRQMLQISIPYSFINASEEARCGWPAYSSARTDADSTPGKSASQTSCMDLAVADTPQSLNDKKETHAA